MASVRGIIAIMSVTLLIGVASAGERETPSADSVYQTGNSMLWVGSDGTRYVGDQTGVAPVGYLQKVNLSCGLPPLPPVGCKLGSCVCDANGNNCRWTFVCD
jgi:hypothetical protein